jgi:hypothetical protein
MKRGFHTCFRRSAVLVSCMSLSVSASALGWFSRACPVGEIPSNVKLSALRLFEAIGAAPIGSLAQIANMSIADQNKYWIHESITTDFGSARYYLYAENFVYRTDATAACTAATHCNITRYETKYKSAGWTATTLSKETLSDSRFQIFFANRAFLYSARAGDPSIVKFWQRASYTPSSLTHDEFSVYGFHYYYDPVAKVQTSLGGSYAYDCNLINWSFNNR